MCLFSATKVLYYMYARKDSKTNKTKPALIVLRTGGNTNSESYFFLMTSQCPPKSGPT